MTSPLPDSVLDEVLGLTLTCLSGEAGPEDVERLNELLCNEAARRIYEDVIRDSFSLRRWADATKLHCGEIFDGCDSDTAFLRLATADPDLHCRHRFQQPQGRTSRHCSRSPPWLPHHHPPRHGRLFLLGLAGGVSGGNGDFRARALDRLPCVLCPSLCRLPGNPSLSPLISPLSASMVGRITGMVDCQVGQSPESRVRIRSRRSTHVPRLARRQVRPGLRPDGNHLRHRGEGHLAGPGDV